MTSVSLGQAISGRRSCREFGETPVPLDAVRALVEAAQGKTDSQGGRAVPSAHAIHPLRLFIAAERIEGLQPGLYAVDPDTGRLEQTIDGSIGAELEDAAIGAQPWIARAAGTLMVCADFAVMTSAFADQPSFGERGARYAFIEAGAAAQNIHLQAVAEGLGAVLVAGFRNEAAASAAGLAAPVTPVLLMCFGYPAKD